MADYNGKWLQDPQMITFEVSDAVATITLNRPDKRNALSPALLAEMRDAMLEADDRSDVNVIVLQGAGKDFCAGYDLDDTYAGRGQDASQGLEFSYRTKVATFDDDSWNIDRLQELTTVMFDLHKPVIAKIQGNCLAGGNDIAFHCDIVIAADDAKIGFPATRANGTPPNQMWLYHMGPQWAKFLLFTGDRISGLDAARIGLVLDSLPPEELDEFVSRQARRMAAVDSELLAAHKRVINVGLELMGAKTLQRMAGEGDARAHLSKGPRRTKFKSDMVEFDLRTALQNRDAPFGDGKVTLRGRAR